MADWKEHKGTAPRAARRATTLVEVVGAGDVGSAGDAGGLGGGDVLKVAIDRSLRTEGGDVDSLPRHAGDDESGGGGADRNRRRRRRGRYVRRLGLGPQKREPKQDCDKESLHGSSGGGCSDRPYFTSS